MKIAMLSDIHGNLTALQAVLDSLKEVDQVLVLGDVVGYYPDFEECLDALEKVSAKCLLGNHEAMLRGDIPLGISPFFKWYAEKFKKGSSKRTRQWLNSLEIEMNIELENETIRLFHGSPWSVTDYVFPNNLDMYPFESLNVKTVVLAHTHRPMDIKKGSVRVLNPGSVGQPRGENKGANYLVFDSSKKEPWSFVNVLYDPAPLISKLKKQGYESIFIQPFLRW